MVEINDILCRILQIEHGFQHIIDGADQIFSAYSKEQYLNFAFEWFKSKDYQVRMLATTMLGRLANEDNNALCFLKEQVSKDSNWRVQRDAGKGF